MAIGTIINLVGYHNFVFSNQKTADKLISTNERHYSIIETFHVAYLLLQTFYIRR